ncbi:MAG: type II toxin-antitoxin system PemK/MazF family toxin [Bifidobacteriaceae bacterium]|jgi:mRNA interferase MazF|nr:type II toxin-antitoxin system PemK/MazF family toxin [Bifidobacteriaceae bacterium]
MISRGDIVTIAVQGDYGKPRAAVVMQSDLMKDLPSLVVCPVTSTIREAGFRLRIEPTAENGLDRVSQVMADKVLTVRRDKLGPRIGAVSKAQLRQLESCLAQVLGFGDRPAAPGQP